MSNKNTYKILFAIALFQSVALYGSYRLRKGIHNPSKRIPAYNFAKQQYLNAISTNNMLLEQLNTTNTQLLAALLERNRIAGEQLKAARDLVEINMSVMIDRQLHSDSKLQPASPTSSCASPSACGTPLPTTPGLLTPMKFRILPTPKGRGAKTPRAGITPRATASLPVAGPSTDIPTTGGLPTIVSSPAGSAASETPGSKPNLTIKIDDSNKS